MSSLLQTEVVWDGVVATVTVTGELDTAAARALCLRLLEVASAHPERIVLDLGGLAVVDAAGAKALDGMQKLLEAGCPVIVRRPPKWSAKVSGQTGLARIRSAPAGGGPGDDLVYRLKAAQARVAASHERTRELLQRVECVLAENRMLTQAVQETCRRWRSGSAPRELLRQSAYARLVAQLQTMPVIEQAKGIIMAQSACGDAEAFDMLRRASRRSNVPVRELAAQLVAKTAAMPASTPAEPRDLAGERGGC